MYLWYAANWPGSDVGVDAVDGVDEGLHGLDALVM